MLKKAGFGIWPAGLLALIIMLQYGMMTGGGVSTMRAVCMFLLSVGAKIAGRIYDMPTGMAVAAILILVGEPSLSAGWGILAVLWVSDRNRMRVAGDSGSIGKFGERG